MTTHRAAEITAFLHHHGYNDAEQRPLAGDASFRRYIRVLHRGNSYMLMDAPPDKEDVKPYIAVAEYLQAEGYSAPRILAADNERGLVLLEDLGDALFTRVLAQSPAQEEHLYIAAIDTLIGWHSGANALNNQCALPLPRYDDALLLREVSLLADWYLLHHFGAAHASILREEFMAIWQALLAAHPLPASVFVHRDYHVDNLLWLPERNGKAKLGILDFQDAVYGDPAYDVVSLLEDARRDVPYDLTQAMLARYIAATGVDKDAFEQSYAMLGAQRNCKIIGIFVRLAVRDNKPGYIKHLPRVWRLLMQDMRHPVLAPLAEWFDRQVPEEKRADVSMPLEQAV